MWFKNDFYNSPIVFLTLFINKNLPSAFEGSIFALGFFIIVLDLRLTTLIRGCRETAFNCLYGEGSYTNLYIPPGSDLIYPSISNSNNIGVSLCIGRCISAASWSI